MNRTVNVVRMQFVNRQTYLVVPLAVLLAAFAISLAIVGVIHASGTRAEFHVGGAQAPLWYLAVVGVQALTLTFPFSQALSVTRREFFTGTMLTAALASAGLAVIVVLGALVERATGGWWFGAYFFSLSGSWQQGALTLGFLFFALGMLFFVVGFSSAAVIRRFGTLAYIVAMTVLALVLIGVIWLITDAGAWGRVWDVVQALDVAGGAVVVLALSAVVAGVGFAALRRTVA